jgi:hypothetical protein
MKYQDPKRLIEDLLTLSEEESCLAERRHDLIQRAFKDAPAPTTIESLAGLLSLAARRGIDVKRLCELVASTDMEPAAIARQVYRESKGRSGPAYQNRLARRWEALHGGKSRDQRHSKINFAGYGDENEF